MTTFCRLHTSVSAIVRRVSFILAASIFCSTALAQATDPDLDNDGCVTGLDVRIVAVCLGENGSTNPNCRFDLADTDADGDVDRDDLNFVLQARGQCGFPIGDNTAPVADAGPDQTVTVGETVALDGSGSFDPDGDALTFSWSLSVPAGSSASLSDSTAVNPNFLADVTGAYAATLTVNDGALDSDPDVVTIIASDPANNPPSITSTPPLNGEQGLLYMYDVDATDPDGDVLTFSLDVAPTGMTIDPASGLIQWTPTAAQVGANSVSVRASDPGGLFATQSFTIVVDGANAAPSITSTPVTTAVEGQLYSYDVDATDPDAGDVLTFSLDVAPTGMSIDPSTGLVQWTPVAAQIGANAVSVRVSDPGGLFASQSYTVFVDGANMAPSITSTPVTTAVEGELYSYDVEATDPNAGDVLTFSLDVAPTGMSIDPSTGLIQWTPTSAQVGTNSVSVRVTDSGGLFASQAYTIDTAGAAIDFLRPEVTLSANPGVAVEVGTVVTLQVVATDDTAVVATELRIDNATVTLDPSGFATFSSTAPGVFELLATAQDAAGNEGAATGTLRFLAAGDVIPPTASISAPARDAVITSPIDVIGTATDDVAIMQHSLRIARAGTNAFHVVDSGNTPVVNGVLGQIDPTLLENGLYDLQLVVEDTAGNTVAATTIFRVEGNLKLGRFSLDFTDLVIPAAGIPIRIDRSYDGRRRAQGDFGAGWELEPEIRVEENGVLGDGWEQTSTGGFLPTFALVPTRTHTVTVTYPDGAQDAFEMTVSPNSQQVLPFSVTTPVNAVFTPRPGTTSDLVSLHGAQLWLNNGAVGPFIFLDDLIGLGDPYDPDRYRVTRQDGMQIDINQLSGIERIIDHNGNVLTRGSGGIIHSGGVVVVFSRDSENRITSITDPLGNVLTYEYDAYGDLVAQTDRQGNVTRYRYDSADRLIEIIDPNNIVTLQIEYDADGRRIAETDANGNRTEHSYDVAGRQETVTDPLGNITVFVYDDRGNVLSEVNALGHATTFAYDASGNELSRTDALGNTTTRSYDASRNLLASTDPLGNTRTFTYDARGHVTSATDPLGNTTTFTYDAPGNRVAQTDANGNTETWTYDTAGNVLSHTLPLGQTETFIYDAVGNVIEQVDFNGDTTTFQYNANNRVIMTTFDDLSTRLLTYTANDQVASVSDSRGVTSNTYDATGRLVERVLPDGQFLVHTYDAAGNRIALTTSLGTSTYAYDATGRLVDVTSNTGAVSGYVYDAIGNQVALSYPNGNTTAYNYDAVGGLIRLVNAGSAGNVLSSYDYVLAADGNRRSVTEADGRLVQYTYDAAGRLIGETTTEPGSTASTIDFSYDAVGNRLDRVIDSSTATTYSYDANNRLLNEGGTTFTYDANGNLLTRTTSSTTTTYGYDFENQLISVSDPGVSATFVYDELGNRVGRSVSGAVSNFLVDTSDRLRRVIAELDGAGAPIVSYTIGTNLISQLRGTADSIYLSDGLGSTRQLADSAGTITDTYDYDAFGNQLAVSGTTPNLFLFAGEEFEPAAGLYYLETRYMDPTVGRYISRDAAPGDESDTRSLNEYVFGLGNPVNAPGPTIGPLNRSWRLRR
jgi:RHS repeat-associated protein